MKKTKVIKDEKTKKNMVIEDRFEITNKGEIRIRKQLLFVKERMLKSIANALGANHISRGKEESYSEFLKRFNCEIVAKIQSMGRNPKPFIKETLNQNYENIFRLSYSNKESLNDGLKDVIEKVGKMIREKREEPESEIKEIDLEKLEKIKESLVIQSKKIKGGLEK